MKKTFLFLTILATAGLSEMNAQVSGNYQYNTTQTINSDRNPASKAVMINNNELLIEVNGLSNIIADNYVAVFNLIQTAETIENTDQLMNNRISIFKQKLQKIGIDTAEIRSDILSFVPKYDIQTESKIFSKTYNEIPSGFELQKNISVRYKHSSKLDEIVSAAAYSEIYDLVKVDYFIPNIQRSLDSLRLKCLYEIKNKTKSYEIIGFRLDTLKKEMTDRFVTIYPQTRYFTYQAFSRPSLNAAKNKSTQPVLNETHKTTSKFYNQVNYDQYDIVINPVIIEPVIQISYSVSVKYFLNPAEKQKNINYYILTPSGEMKPFQPK